ncbi:arylamine N-acetyltransferase family protein [Laceyella sediminis]|uniref:arylamine N-acetyltransferase family protein n=1 Tax=Laceyella sediminis TaxID=573074 RepID=UPI001CB8F513|nr:MULTISPECIES: arylamine N-acetyltransferase [Laceyella]
MQNQHLLTLPYQNISYFKRGDDWITFDDPELLVSKTISRLSGGICYHLNYSLYWLLQELGFNCILISCYLSRFDLDHMAVIVSLDQQYLVDVGFGEFFFRNPIPLDGNVVEEISGYYRVKMSKETGRFLLQQRKKKRWKTRYSFNLNPRQLKDFEGIYQWLISNPNAYTTNVMFRKQLKKGYLGLHNDRLTIIEGNAIRRMQIPWYRSLID